MKNLATKIRSRSTIFINRQINKQKLKRKVFCIGLHKTGTTSIYEIAIRYGYKATHSTDWAFDSKKIEKFEFFCDGGSHFDDQNEFNFRHLANEYPDSLFILQTRDTRSWIISKLKHAGWNEKTEVKPDNKEKIRHDDWEYKSFLTIDNLIRHKYNYEQKAIKFFDENDPDRLLVIDIVDRNTQDRDIAKLVAFLELRSISKIELPHRNKARSIGRLAEEVLVFIDQAIAACESEGTNKPHDLESQVSENAKLRNS